MGNHSWYRRAWQWPGATAHPARDAAILGIAFGFVCGLLRIWFLHDAATQVMPFSVFLAALFGGMTYLRLRRQRPSGDVDVGVWKV